MRRLRYFPSPRYDGAFTRYMRNAAPTDIANAYDFQSGVHALRKVRRGPGRLGGSFPQASPVYCTLSYSMQPFIVSILH